MAKNPFIKIGSLLMTAVFSVSMLSVAGVPALKAKAEDTEPTVFKADFSSLPNGAVDDNDTATVEYLKERFSFYFYQHLTEWKLDSGPLMYFFERPGVNGYLVDDGVWRLPDTAGLLHHTIDGQPSTEGHDTVLSTYYVWDKIPTWTIEDGWIYCTAYSGDNATPFRQANLMYVRGNTENTLANIKNFDLQMDLMFRQTDGETIKEGKDAFVVIFDGATAGNVNSDKQLMFAVTPEGKYFLGKPVERYTTECNEQFTNADDSNVTFERGKKYHLSMRHIGNTVVIEISDADGNVLVQHEAAVPTVLSGVGGNLAIGGSNAGAKYANITLTRLDDDAKAYDFDNRANGYQFGFTARELGNWVSPYWSDWDLAQNALYMRNSASVYWSNKWPDSYGERVYYTANGESMFDFNAGASLKAYASKMGEKFNVYHDAVNGGTHYFAKAPEFNSHHVQSGIDGSYFGIMYLSASSAQSMALTAYLDKGKNPEALLDQTMSLVPKTSDGQEVQTKNFRTQFTVRLPASSKSGVALSFRSAKAGAAIGEIGHGYADKITLLLSGCGYYLDTGSGDLVQNGAPSVWAAWDDAAFTEGDATVYAEAIGTALKLRVVAANGSVLLDDTLTIPDGNSGCLYYSALDTHGYFYSLSCDRLDESGKVTDWNQKDGETLLSDLDAEGRLKTIGHAGFVDNAFHMDHSGAGFEVKGNISGDMTVFVQRTDNDAYLNVSIDGAEPTRIKVPVGSSSVRIVENLEKGSHTVRVTSATSPSFGTWTVTGIGFAGTLDCYPSDDGKLRMLAIGDSITAGYGVYGKNGDSTDTANKIEMSDAYASYASIAARELGAELDLVAKEAAPISEVHSIVNALDMRAGSPAWEWAAHKNDVIVINLGTNDEWINGKTPETALADAKALLDDMRAKNPDAEIIWVYGMMRKDYEASYRAAVQYMNDKGDDKVYLLEMAPDTTALEGHPSAAAHKEYGKQLADFIRSKCADLVGKFDAHTDTLKALDDNGQILLLGRSCFEGTALSTYYGAAGFTISGELCGEVELTLTQGNENITRLDIVVDGDTAQRKTVRVEKGTQTIRIADGLSRGEHTITVRRAASDHGTTMYKTLSYTGTLTKPNAKALQIEFIGDSITVTEGSYGRFDAGNKENFILYQNAMTGYAAQTAEQLGAEFSMLAHCGATTQNMLNDYKNANTNFTNGADRKDIVVINLGTNDIGYTDLDESGIAALRKTIGELLDAVVEQNGKHVCIVWAYGMMSTKGLDVIRDAVTAQANGRNIWFCDLSAAKNNDGYGDHPALAGHTAAAGILAQFITDNCLPAIEAEHKLVKIEAKAADCQHEGNIEYYTCSACGKLFADANGTQEIEKKDTVVAKKGHNLTKTDAKAATHFAAGNIEYYTCSACGKLFADANGTQEITQADTVIDKIAHTYGGYQYNDNGHWKECSCGDKTAEGTHTGGTATCNEKAICKVCGAKYGTVDKTKHDETEVRDAKAATCIEDGYTGDTYCKVCGDKLQNGTVIPAAHDLTKVEAKAATTESEGNIEHWCCADCGKLFTDAEGKQELSAADVVIAKLPAEEKPNSTPDNNGDKSQTTGEHFYSIVLAAAAGLAAIAALIAVIVKKKKGGMTA